MKKYTASNELIDVLIKNGFTEITKQKRPEHFKRLIENDYDPHKIKRAFSIDSHLTNFIELDYIMILPRYKEGVSGINMKTELSSDELKSIITFYKLPPQTKSAIHRAGLKIVSLHRDYYLIKKNIEFYKKRKGDLMLLEIFESIIL